MICILHPTTEVAPLRSLARSKRVGESSYVRPISLAPADSSTAVSVALVQTQICRTQSSHMKITENPTTLAEYNVTEKNQWGLGFYWCSPSLRRPRPDANTCGFISAVV